MHILDPKHALDPPAQFWPFNPIAQTSGRAHSRPTSEKMPRLPVKDIQHPETSWQVGFVGVILHPDWTSHFTGGIQNGSWRPWSYFWVWTRHEKTKRTVSVSQLNLRDCWMIGGLSCFSVELFCVWKKMRLRRWVDNQTTLRGFRGFLALQWLRYLTGDVYKAITGKIRAQRMMQTYLSIIRTRRLSSGSFCVFVSNRLDLGGLITVKMLLSWANRWTSFAWNVKFVHLNPDNDS